MPVVNVVNIRTATEEELATAHYVGRPSPLGNPFSAKEHGRDEALSKYEDWLNLQYFNGNQEVIERLHSLAIQLKDTGTITLSCWCHPKPCHADLVGRAISNMIKRNLV